MSLNKILPKLTGKNISDREGIEIELAEFRPVHVVFTTVAPTISLHHGRITVVHNEKGEIIEILLDEPDDSQGIYA